MIPDPQGTVLALFLVFCRIGGCMMALPGFSSIRLSATIRLFVALAVSLALLPLMWEEVYPRVSDATPTYIGLIFSETLIGTTYGLIARFFADGLQFAGSITAMFMGFNAPPSAPDIVEGNPESPMTSMLVFAGLMMLFALNFHEIVFRALIDSYKVMPVGAFGREETQRMLITLTDTIDMTFHIMLRLSSPFLLYGLMFNVSIGMINKLAQQVPIYFISMPYHLMGGLFLFYLCIAAFLRQFADAFPSVFLGH
ncbi:flagellar biosynthetic protein FliR [Rhizobium sp. PAMB 3182]